MVIDKLFHPQAKNLILNAIALLRDRHRCVFNPMAVIPIQRTIRIGSPNNFRNGISERH